MSDLMPGRSKPSNAPACVGRNLRTSIVYIHITGIQYNLTMIRANVSKSSVLKDRECEMLAKFGRNVAKVEFRIRGLLKLMILKHVHFACSR